MQQIPVPGFPNYLATEQGTIISKKLGRELVLSNVSNGYLNCTLYCGAVKRTCLVHRVIQFAFGLIDSLDSELEIDHKDENKHNNKPSNLQPLTRAQHQDKTLQSLGLTRKPIKEPKQKICPDITAEDIEFWVSNYSWVRAQRELGLSDNGLRKRYRSLTGREPKDIKRNTGKSIRKPATESVLKTDEG